VGGLASHVQTFNPLSSLMLPINLPPMYVKAPVGMVRWEEGGWHPKENGLRLGY